MINERLLHIEYFDESKNIIIVECVPLDFVNRSF